jgi:hypothetical protein
MNREPEQTMSEQTRADLQQLIDTWRAAIQTKIQQGRPIAPDAIKTPETPDFSLADMAANDTLGLTIGYSVAVEDLERLLAGYVVAKEMEREERANGLGE